MKTEDAKAINQKTHDIRLLEHLTKLEVSREEWQEIQEQNPARKLGLDKNLFRNHHAFYKNTRQRDKTLFENMMSFMDRSGRTLSEGDPDGAILVAGGFHTEGFVDQMKDHNNLVFKQKL